MASSEKLHNADLLYINDTKALKRRALESVISPISSNDSGSRHEGKAERSSLYDASLRTCDVKDLVRKCLSEYKEWEGKQSAGKPALAKGAAESSDSQKSPLCLASLAKEKKEAASSEQKLRVKRSFARVDTSPSQELGLVKKTNAQYRRGCKIVDIPEKRSTSLTTEINCLKLAGDGGLRETCADDSQAKAFSGTGHGTGGKPATSLIAKNLMHDLDADSEKDGKKEHLSSSFLCIDDEKPLASMSMDSDLSLPEASAAGMHLEKHLSQTAGSIKALPSEELKTENASEMSLSWADASSKGEDVVTVQEGKELQHEQDKSLQSVSSETHPSTHFSPSAEMMKALTHFKKNMVAFRSYNSSINTSNISEPSRISTISVEGMDISACSGSYPMTITPAQKGKPYRVYQVRPNIGTLDVTVPWDGAVHCWG